ncbi:Oidioi.mRNA.OKI2018_I69.XSR.g15537.t2.cds [Oikopleura dioica]|uniref:Oidioi.mRNA.OKI2018_I69.XSR.g15537.t2.cds n=1 Tax=Oikopleura dioica TaxID=34765 RepID=A0ABN7SDQ6_OIKDI|nr:Oidioi.mRNA.OKI2018_I69.XSR.g15537.t2.cds [Oikopleura dioica]
MKYSRSRSRSRSRSFTRSISRSRSRYNQQRCRERSFSLSPIRPGGFQPQGFARATRGFVKELPESIKRAYERIRRPSKIPPRQKLDRGVSQEVGPKAKERDPSRPREKISLAKTITISITKSIAKHCKVRERISKEKKTDKKSKESEEVSKAEVPLEKGTEEQSKSRKKSDNVTRTVDQNMSISKCRQLVLHRKAEFTTIFSHVDQSKLPKDPDAIVGASTVSKGNLLQAIFGGDEEEESDKELDEPEALKAAKIKASKEDRKNTTGIKLNDRITWWAEMNDGHASASSSGSEGKESKPKKRKTKRKSSPETVSRTITMTVKESRGSVESRSTAISATRSQSSERNARAASREQNGAASRIRTITRKISRSTSRRRSRSRRSRSGRSGSRRSGSRRRSQSPIIRDSRNFENGYRRGRYIPGRSRSRSRGRSPSLDAKRKPCVFFFSKEAKGCKWSARECKFSHNQDDYDYWKRQNGHELPNTGLIHRTEPVYPTERNRRRSRSFSPRR